MSGIVSFSDYVAASANLAGALDDAVDVLCRYVHFASPEQAWAVTLWAAATHRADDFSILPRLAIRAPTKQSGKTRLLEVVAQLVAKGWGPVVGPSAAALYRKIEADRPTILLDEVDRLFEKRAEDNAAIIEVLNGGHTNGSTVPRVVGMGTKQSVRDFPVYAPVALAGIASNWPDTLLDRSIIVTLERRRSDEPVERYRMEHHAIPRAAGERIAEQVADVAFMRVRLPDFLSDRAMDNWEPLYQVAEAAGGDWHERVAQAADVLGRAAADIMAADERDEVLLLSDVVGVFADEAPISGFMGSKDLLEKLKALDARPWADWPHGFTTTRMARMLGTLGIHPFAPFGSAKRGYDQAAVDAVWGRLGTR